MGVIRNAESRRDLCVNMIQISMLVSVTRLVQMAAIYAPLILQQEPPLVNNVPRAWTCMATEESAC
jgi:hypothetical protein